MPAKLAQAAEAAEVAHVRALRSKSYQLLAQAEAAGDLRTALVAVREARSTVELLARLAGELAEGVVVSVLVSPQLSPSDP